MAGLLRLTFQCDAPPSVQPPQVLRFELDLVVAELRGMKPEIARAVLESQAKQAAAHVE